MQEEFHVGHWHVRPQLDEIHNGVERVHLKRKAMEILVVLARHAGEMVPKEQLFEEVWRATWVTDAVLSQAVFELRRALGDSARDSRWIQTVPRRGYRLLARVTTAGQAAPGTGTRPEVPAIGSLAILPLVNLSDDPRQEYFVDGMTEALIGDLAQIGALRVISRTSVVRYKGTQKPIPEIARELGVDGIVEGSVLRAGDRIRISVQLVHGPTDSHLWARSYERELDDVLALQRGVARAIAREIQLRLNPRERARLEASRLVPPAAHEAYLLGRFFLNQRTTAALEKSVVHFERAIGEAPDHALAFTGLADALTLLGSAGYGVPAPAVLERARAAARRALELDPSLAEAHTSLAFIAFRFDWSWREAEAAFRRAIEFSPNLAGCRHWYALYLSAMGRHDEALAQIGEARLLDPLSLIVHAADARVRHFAGDHEGAIARCRTALEMAPDYAEAHFNLGMVLLQQGRFADAVAALEQAQALSGQRPLVVSVLGHAWARWGRRAEAERVLASLEELARAKAVSPGLLALLHLGLGETAQALGELEQAVEQRYGPSVFLRVEPMFDVLRPHPRFRALLARLGLND